MFFATPSSMLHSVAMFFSTLLTGLRLALPQKVGQAAVPAAPSSSLTPSAVLVATATTTSSSRLDWFSVVFASPVGVHETTNARVGAQSERAMPRKYL